MSITAIEIVQSNITPSCNLISVHQPLVFLANVTWNTELPMDVYVQLRSPDDDGNVNLVGTFKALPYKDVSALVRQYAFVADGIIRSLMDDFKDFESEEKTLEFCPTFTKEFDLYFLSSLDEQTSIKATCSFIACHAAQQYGDDTTLLGIQNNTQNIIYYGGADRMVYVYVYNNNANNDLRVESESEYWVDFDDVPFTDTNLYLKSE